MNNLTIRINDNLKLLIKQHICTIQYQIFSTLITKTLISVCFYTSYTIISAPLSVSVSIFFFQFEQGCPSRNILLQTHDTSPVTLLTTHTAFKTSEFMYCFIILEESSYLVLAANAITFVSSPMHSNGAVDTVTHHVFFLPFVAC